MYDKGIKININWSQKNVICCKKVKASKQLLA